MFVIVPASPRMSSTPSRKAAMRMKVKKYLVKNTVRNHNDIITAILKLEGMKSVIYGDGFMGCKRL